MLGKFALLLIAIALCASVAMSQTGNGASSVTAPAARSVSVPPEKAKPLRIPRIEKPPVIDGKLNDDAWKQAVVLKDFYQISPGDNIAPSAPTEVYLAYDSKFLYVGVHAFDDPSQVRASVAARDNVFG